jgi:histidyl-tRNA synthetase
MQKPTLPRGTRDFGPVQMARRNFIFDTIKKTFQQFGFLPLETPAMENLSVLMGKYGEEGDQLLFKILNSADFINPISKKLKPYLIQQQNKNVQHFSIDGTNPISYGELLDMFKAIGLDFSEIEISKMDQSGQTIRTSKKIALQLSEKGLRYDLTVPFARYVVMNRNDITFPFKRYQIQPVWRGDNPQKGRYREFYQCDADVVGTNSLLCEAEIVCMINQVLGGLGITDYTIKINNRKVLTALAEVAGAPGQEGPLCVAIDKLDKIGREKVEQELTERGFSAESIGKLDPVFTMQGTFDQKVERLRGLFETSAVGREGLTELERVIDLVAGFGLENPHLEFDVTLARGLSYYTGAIFEVKVNNVGIGSISGGGRYDNLTGAFGLPGVSGVGFSFGVDRIYDVMEELGLFPAQSATSTRVLLVAFDAEAQRYALPVLRQLREAGINSELYPDTAKLKKQLDYANAKGIPYVVLIGSNEMATGQLALKDMTAGTQQSLELEALIKTVGSY